MMPAIITSVLALFNIPAGRTSFAVNPPPAGYCNKVASSLGQGKIFAEARVHL